MSQNQFEFSYIDPDTGAPVGPISYSNMNLLCTEIAKSFHEFSISEMQEICSWWDCPSNDSSGKRGDNQMVEKDGRTSLRVNRRTSKNVCMNALFGIQPAIFTQVFGQKGFEGGMLARFLYIYGEESEDKSRDFFDDEARYLLNEHVDNDTITEAR